MMSYPHDMAVCAAAILSKLETSYVDSSLDEESRTESADGMDDESRRDSQITEPSEDEKAIAFNEISSFALAIRLAMVSLDKGDARDVESCGEVFEQHPIKVFSGDEIQRASLLTLFNMVSSTTLTFFVTHGMLNHCRFLHAYVGISAVFQILLITVFCVCILNLNSRYKINCNKGELLRAGMRISCLVSFGAVLRAFVFGGPSPALIGISIGLLLELMSTNFKSFLTVRNVRVSNNFAVDIGISVMKCGTYTSVAQNLWNYEHNHSFLPVLCICVAIAASLLRYLPLYFTRITIIFRGILDTMHLIVTLDC